MGFRIPVAALILVTLLCAGETLPACGGRAPEPAALQPGTETCASCRMAVSSQSTASQIVVPGEEPQFFDDLGCLAAYLRQHALAAEAAVFVADHRTSAWIDAAAATYARVPQLDTPMGSHLVAHADLESRAADGAARGSDPVDPREILGGAPRAAGRRQP